MDNQYNNTPIPGYDNNAQVPPPPPKPKKSLWKKLVGSVVAVAVIIGGFIVYKIIGDDSHNSANNADNNNSAIGSDYQNEDIEAYNDRLLNEAPPVTFTEIGWNIDENANGPENALEYIQNLKPISHHVKLNTDFDVPNFGKIGGSMDFYMNYVSVDNVKARVKQIIDLEIPGFGGGSSPIVSDTVIDGGQGGMKIIKNEICSDDLFGGCQDLTEESGTAKSVDTGLDPIDIAGMNEDIKAARFIGSTTVVGVDVLCFDILKETAGAGEARMYSCYHPEYPIFLKTHFSLNGSSHNMEAVELNIGPNPQSMFRK